MGLSAAGGIGPYKTNNNKLYNFEPSGMLFIYQLHYDELNNKRYTTAKQYKRNDKLINYGKSVEMDGSYIIVGSDDVDGGGGIFIFNQQGQRSTFNVNDNYTPIDVNRWVHYDTHLSNRTRLRIFHINDPDKIVCCGNSVTTLLNNEIYIGVEIQIIN